jgi:6-phosphogluconolactonase
MNVPHLYPTAEAAAAACSDFILDRLREAIEQRGRAALAVSGGHTPGLLFAVMREAEFPWDGLGFYFVDERAVPADDKESNYRLADETFLKPLNFPAPNVHRVKGELPPRQAAAEYADEIRANFALSEGALPVFDVIQHGMGPDGHTASLFPGDPFIQDRTGIAAAVRANKPPPGRITLLPGVLLASRSTVFLLNGEDKKDALRSVLTGDLDPMKFPSQLVARSGKQVDWFLDLPWF